jgi:ABC-type multidrug transport system fused ATPase/permease subunit
MNRINLNMSNYRIAILLTLLIVVFGMFGFIGPLILLNMIPQSIIGSFFMQNSLFIVLAILVLLYFVFTGIYVFKVNIDAYIIAITSYRSLSSVFKQRDYVDIPHAMLVDFDFFNRPFSLNTTLMLKIKSQNKKQIVKRFNMTLLTAREKNKINNILQGILNNNK